MKRLIYSMFAVLSIASACSKEITTNDVLPESKWNGIVILADCNSLTRTDIDRGTSSWEVGDEISVIYDGKVYIYRTEESGTEVSFYSEDGIKDYDPSKKIVAYYPPISIDGLVEVPAERAIVFLGEDQTNSAKAPLVGITEGNAFSEGSLRMTFKNICSVMELRIDASEMSDVVHSIKIEPESAFEGYLSFSGSVDAKTLAITTSTKGNSITLILPENTRLDQPLTLKFPVGRFKAPNGLRVTVEGFAGSGRVSRVVYADGIESYSERGGTFFVKHFSKPLYPFYPPVVDLGLPSGIKWASCNLGANSPDECGDYYAWGETETKGSYDRYAYKWYSASLNGFIKYNVCGSAGIPDQRVILERGEKFGETMDDVARAKLGDKWRMPTDVEFTELISNCDVTQVTLNGRPGAKFTSKMEGYTDKWIFFPTTGYGSLSALSDYERSGYYWSSREDVVYLEDFAYCLRFNVDLRDGLSPFSAYVNRSNREYGLPVRPILDEEDFTMTMSHSSPQYLFAGSSEYMWPIRTPNTRPVMARKLTWISTDTSVITVTPTGLVTAVSEGVASVIVICGGKTAVCDVTVLKPMEESAVDLGLPSGIKWATCNLGANSPEEAGDYYAWGETELKADYSWSTYKFGTSNTGPFSKYNTDSSYGSVDNNTELDTEDDVASVKLGDKWRMPLNAEFQELIDNCNATWGMLNGVYGRMFTSKITGYEDKWVFFPAAGRRQDTGIYSDGSHGGESTSGGFYWSSSLSTDSPDSAIQMCINKSFVNIYYLPRFNGFSIRPVCEEL